tara:strand:+ start:4159 stop:4473 length:315 start_codon:yes stop_codon:yes gene_type:complete
MNIEEVLAKITLSQHKLEVYQDIEAYLEEYLPSDTGEAPETLEVSVPCMAPKVSFGAIECILGELSKLKVSEKGTLKALNAMEAKNGKPKRKSTTTRKSKSTPK